MDTLPEDIQSKIYLDKHTLEFHTTLEKIKHVKSFIDYSEEDINEFNYSTELLSDGNESKRSPPSDYSLREMIEKDSDETSTCFTYTRTEDWDLDMEDRFNDFEEMYEIYKLFIDAGTLTNCLSLKEQLQPLTNNRKIHIDISCDVKYFFDEHFFDVRFWDWEYYENKCNITLDKTKLSRSTVPRMHRRCNKIWFTYNGALPVLVCDIIHIIQCLNMKAMGDHRYLASVRVVGRRDLYTEIEIGNDS